MKPMERCAWLTITTFVLTTAAFVAIHGRGSLEAQSRTPAASKAVISAPVGPSPYEVVRGWHKPFAEHGYAFGGNSGVFAESPSRIFVAQRGETKLPDPIPDGYAGFAGSIGINVLNAVDRRVWRNCLYTLDGDGLVKERWTQWDQLCEGSSGPGPHRVRISPYDSERRVWVINETFNTIYVFSNDGSKLLKTLGEAHCGKVSGKRVLSKGRTILLPCALPMAISIACLNSRRSWVSSSRR